GSGIDALPGILPEDMQPAGVEEQRCEAVLPRLELPGAPGHQWKRAGRRALEGKVRQCLVPQRFAEDDPGRQPNVLFDLLGAGMDVLGPDADTHLRAGAAAKARLG